ncbi:MAG: tetratricopeptide repeat protein [Calditrichaeota bacterium]|nr:tetratricopeptide repeat protein [Calditrichota bacterium]
MGKPIKIAILLLLVLSVSALMFSCGPKPIKQQSVMDTPDYHYQMGMRELNRGNLQAAMEEFGRAKALDPKYPGAYVGMGLVYCKQGNFKEAYKAVDKGIDLNDKFLEGYIAKGRIITKERKGDDWVEKAVKQYNKALKKAEELAKKDPNMRDQARKWKEEAYFYMGETYKNGFKFRDAENAFSRVVEMKGDYAEKANAEWELVQKIVRAAPGTKIGAKIALIPEIDRADLAVLLIEEMKLLDVFEKRRPKTFDTGFRPPADPTKFKAAVQSNKPDITDIQNHWAKRWIEDIVTVGGMSTFPDHTFKPDQKITRADFANVVQNILIAVTGDQSLATKYIGEPSHFPDVPSTHWAYNAITLCVDRGIMHANKIDGSFGLTKPVSGADALLMIRDFQNALRMTF